MKTLIILSAPPGSGKSTWALAYQKSHDSTYIISSDEIRYELTGSRQDFTKQKEVWETFSKRIHEYALLNENVTVILDALCDLNVLRAKYVKENDEYDRYILILFPHTKEECYNNNFDRGEDFQVPSEVFNLLWEKFEPVTPEIASLYNEIREVTFIPQSMSFKETIVK